MLRTAIQCKSVAAPLDAAPINAEWIRSGRPAARNAVLFDGVDRAATTVLWDCTPGAFDWHYDADETVVILEGTVVLDDGVTAPRRVTAGDVVLFPAGAVVHWTVETPVRKLAFFSRPVPRPVALACRVLRACKALFDAGLNADPARAGRRFAAVAEAGLGGFTRSGDRW